MNLSIPSTKKFFETFKRFPLAMISSMIVVGVSLFLIEMEPGDMAPFEPLLRLGFVASLGVFLFAALALMREKNPLCLLGIALLVGYYFILPDMQDPSRVIFMRHLFLALAFFIMIVWAPFYNRSIDNERHWEWTQRVIFGLLMAIVFSIVLYGGLSGGLFAVDKLFSLGISGKRYGQLWFVVVGIFGVSYFLSQIPKDRENLTPHSYTKVENIFTKYILTPLAFGYFIILYAYSAKILISQAWPKGILAWIIIAFSAVALITYLFWTPLLSQKLKKYRRFFFVVLLLQTLMLALALGMRIEAYGWTENRYMVALFGAWLGVISLYFILFGDARYKWLFLTLSLAIMISQVGPWSAYEVGKKSQQKRLASYLKNNPKLSNDTPLQLRYEISSMIEYLARHHGIDALAKILPASVQKYKKEHADEMQYYGFSFFATNELGFEFVDRWQIEEFNRLDRPVSIFASVPFAYNVSGYDWMVEVQSTMNDASAKRLATLNDEIKAIETTFLLNKEWLIIKEKKREIAKIELKEFFDNIIKNSRYDGTIDSEKMQFLYHDSNVSIKLMIDNLFIDRENGYDNIHARILYKRKGLL